MCLSSRIMPLLAAVALVLGQQDACGTDPAAPFCSADEVCCKDSPQCTGACTECCLSQATFCVAPRPGFTTSTCCPRWTIGGDGLGSQSNACFAVSSMPWPCVCTVHFAECGMYVCMVLFFTPQLLHRGCPRPRARPRLQFVTAQSVGAHFRLFCRYGGLL